MRPVLEYIIWKGRYMKIKKKLNNNVAVVTDKTGNEIIVIDVYKRQPQNVYASYSRYVTASSLTVRKKASSKGKDVYKRQYQGNFDIFLTMY